MMYGGIIDTKVIIGGAIRWATSIPATPKHIVNIKQTRPLIFKGNSE